MGDFVLAHGLQYLTYAAEVCVGLLLVRRATWRRLKGLCLYVAVLFLLDGVARPAVLNYFGLDSPTFKSFYWLTDVVLALGAFLLICSFFRRACAQEEKLWRFVRLLLLFVFILVLVISAVYILRNPNHNEAGGFTAEIGQNLFFTGLVLNTLLYVMIQQFAIEDDELALLVGGIGIQFAGEAALLALCNLLPAKSPFTDALSTFLPPICTLGMLLTWAYAISKTPQEVPVRLQPGRGASLAEAIADS
ncbi:MAG: hypothetical protein ABSF14_15085 [Terriglobia bacterium]|jgi:hypothetical protein